MEENKTLSSENTEQNIPKDKLPTKPKKKEEKEIMFNSEWYKKNMPWTYQNL